MQIVTDCSVTDAGAWPRPPEESGIVWAPSPSRIANPERLASLSKDFTKKDQVSFFVVSSLRSSFITDGKTITCTARLSIFEGSFYHTVCQYVNPSLTHDMSSLISKMLILLLH